MDLGETFFTFTYNGQLLIKFSGHVALGIVLTFLGSIEIKTSVHYMKMWNAIFLSGKSDDGCPAPISIVIQGFFGLSIALVFGVSATITYALAIDQFLAQGDVVWQFVWDCIRIYLIPYCPICVTVVA